jgi:hypothetical protein
MAELKVIDGNRRDSVERLHQFQGDHPEVTFTSPTMGRYGQYTAVVPPGTIPGEDRELMLKSPDLRGLMDQLDDVFSKGTR